MLAFILLGLSILSVWVRRDQKIWLSFLFMSVILGLAGGSLLVSGAFAIGIWSLLWFNYEKKPTLPLFWALVAGGYILIWNYAPGFIAYPVTQKLRLGFKPVLGLLPLALLIPVAITKSDWIKAIKGFLFGIGGISLMALLAIGLGATKLQMKLPPFPWIVYLSNLVLVVIPEEAFFRGFIQNRLSQLFNNRAISLFLTSLLFALAHIYWSPNLMILIFTFIAGLLYGGVYLISKKIESAILTHFLLNFIHITFFNYHAL